MTRFWGRAGGALIVTAIATVWAPGCAHNDSTLFVLDVLAPQSVAQGTKCLFTSDPTQPYLASGILDVALRSSYTGYFLVGNQMLSQVSTSAPRTETSYVNVQGAYVTVRDLSGNFLNQFTVDAAATIAPASGATPSYEAIGVTIVDSATAALVAPGTVVSAVRFFGKTLGGQSVESEEFHFPVEICDQCLIYFSPSDVNSAFKAPNCVGTGTTPMTEPCLPGQDWPLDCAFCKGVVAACDPPRIPITTDGGGTATDAATDTGTDAGDAGTMTD